MKLSFNYGKKNRGPIWSHVWPTYPPWCDQPNAVWWEVKFVRILVMSFSQLAFSCPANVQKRACASAPPSRTNCNLYPANVNNMASSNQCQQMAGGIISASKGLTGDTRLHNPQNNKDSFVTADCVQVSALLGVITKFSKETVSFAMNVSVRPLRTVRFPLDVFSWKFIFGTLIGTCQVSGQFISKHKYDEY